MEGKEEKRKRTYYTFPNAIPAHPAPQLISRVCQSISPSMKEVFRWLCPVVPGLVSYHIIPSITIISTTIQSVRPSRQQ